MLAKYKEYTLFVKIENHLFYGGNPIDYVKI